MGYDAKCVSCIARLVDTQVIDQWTSQAIPEGACWLRPYFIRSGMIDMALLLIVGLTFLLAGGVKGVIGMGLPTVSLALLTLIVGLPEAMALLLVPSFVTNLWQGVAGGYLGEILRRLWLFLGLAMITVWIGGAALVSFDLAYLAALLGVLLVAYALLSLLGVRFETQPRHEAWVGPLMGVTNGVLTGMTGSFVVPGVMYLQSLNLPRDMFIQSMGVLFTASTVALAITLGSRGFLDQQLGWLSLAAVIPALIGMEFGKRLRSRLSEAVFRRVFFLSVLVVGLFIAGRNLLLNV